MGTMSENMLNLFNLQYAHETYNALRYDQRANWCDFNGYNGCAAFYHQEANGEHEHAQKVLEFINDRSSMATIQPINFDEPNNWDDLIQLFETAQAVEYDTTRALTAIYSAAMAESDIMAVNWAADMIAKQLDEEREYSTILDRFRNFPASPSRNHDIDVWVLETFVK